MVMAYDYDRGATRTAASVFYEELPKGLKEVREELKAVKEASGLAKTLVGTVREMEKAGTDLGRDEPKLVRDLVTHLRDLAAVGKGQQVKKLQAAIGVIERLEGGLHSQPWQAVVSKSGAFGEVLRAMADVTFGIRTWVMRNKAQPAVAAFLSWYEKDWRKHIAEIDKAQKDAAPANKTAAQINDLIKYLSIDTGLMRTQMSRFMDGAVKQGIDQWNDIQTDVKLASQYFEIADKGFFENALELEAKLGRWLDIGERLVKALETAVKDQK